MSNSTVFPSPSTAKSTGVPTAGTAPTLYARVYAQLVQLLAAMALR
jgi:hypothetical protein